MSEVTPFKAWYSKHKKKINADRRAKYRTDEEYRNQVLESARAARVARPAPSKAGQSRFKEVGGVVVETIPISELAEYCGKSIQTIRLWESHGLIPAPTVAAGKRFYTLPQRDLVRELSVVMDSSRSLSQAERASALGFVKNKVKALWSAN